MSVSVTIVDGPIPEEPDPANPASAGAVVVFQGVARAIEQGRPIAALEYEVYEPMASQMLDRIARDLVDRFGLVGIDVAHSRGSVPAGACSLRLRVVGRHRGECFQAACAFIDRLKRDVPIWKHPIWSEPDPDSDESNP